MDKYSDLKFNNGTYIPQYAGAPLEEVQKSADVLAGRHYQNLASLNQLQLLREQYKSKMLPGASSYVDEQFGDIDSALQDIAKNGGENSTARVGAITNRFLGDQGVLKAMQRADEVRKEIELENQIVAKDGFALRKKGLRENLMNAPIIDPETGKLNKSYESPYQSSVTSYIDPVKPMEEIWKTINPDSWESAIKAADKTTIKDLLGKSMAKGMPDVPLFFESLTSAGITDTKIQNQLGNAWASYQETPAYKQAIEYAENSEAEKVRQKDTFYKHGLLRIYNNVSRQYMSNPVADDLIRNAGKKTEGGLHGESLGFDSLGKVDFPDMPEAPKEPVQPITSPVQYGVGGSKQAVQNQNTGKVYTNAQEELWRKKKEQYQEDLTEYNKQQADYNKYVSTAAEIYGQPKPADGSKEAKELVDKLAADTNGRMENQEVFAYNTEEQRTAAANDIRSNLYGRKVYDVTEEEGNTYKDNNAEVRDEFLGLMQVPDNDFRVSGVINPLGPVARKAGLEFANSKLVSVADQKTGKVRLFAITDSDGDLRGRPAQRNEFNHQLYSAVNARPGQEVEVPIQVYSNGKRQPFVTLKAQEHIGGQRTALIEKLKQSNLTVEGPDGQPIPLAEYAQQHEKIFTVKKPGDSVPHIYFNLNEISQDFLPDEQ